MADLTQGARSAFTAPPGPGNFKVTVSWQPAPGIVVDGFALLTDANARMRRDDSVVFFGQQQVSGVRQTENRPGKIEFDVPSYLVADGTRARLAVAASNDAGKPVDLDAAAALMVTVTDPGASETIRYAPTRWGAGVSCGVLGDLYERSGSIRVAAVGQGWDGGIEKLLTEHGATIDSPTTTPTPAAVPEPVSEAAPKWSGITTTPRPQSAPTTPAKVSFTKEERRAHNVSLIKDTVADPAARVQMEKRYRATTGLLDRFHIPENKAKVCLVLDISGSTGSRGNNLYGDGTKEKPGTMQELALRALAMSLEWDLDGNVDVIVFDTHAEYVGALGLSSISNYLDGIAARAERGGGTDFRAPLRVLEDLYFTGQKRAAFDKGESVFVLFGTDGDVNDRDGSTKRGFNEMASRRIMFKITKLGRGPFSFIDNLDKMNEGPGHRPGTYDNIDVMDLGADPRLASDEVFVRQLTKGYLTPGDPRPSRFGRRAEPAPAPWVQQANGLLVPAAAGPDFGGLGL